MYLGLLYADKKMKLDTNSFFGKCLLEYKFRFAFENKAKKRFRAISVLLHENNASPTIFTYDNHLYPKKNFFFHLQSVLFDSNSRRN